jgi:methionyl-tRNA synthetase
MDYLTQLASLTGISLWILIVVLVWSAVWKLLALWKSARKGHVVWFILLAVINTIGILEILYVYIFSEIKFKKKSKKKDKRKVKRR